MYTRNSIAQARSEILRNEPHKPGLLNVPVDAEYRGPGPLFVWTGELWLDWNMWMQSADLMPPGAPVAMEAVPAPAAKPKKQRRSDAPTLFD